MQTRSEPLARHTTIGLGGSVSHFFEASTDEALLEAVRFARAEGLPLLPLGGGSNLVVRDEDFRALVLKVGTRGIRFESEGPVTRVTASAGENWHDFVALTIERNLAGLECLGGIPGRVGATPIQNVGAYGQEVAETIERVRTLDLHTLESRVWSASELGFSYRDSHFKSVEPNRFLVLDVTFRLLSGGPPKVAYAELRNALGERTDPSLREVFETIVDLRAKKSMYLGVFDENHRSCGSFFVNAIVGAEDVARVEAVAGERPPAHRVDQDRFKLASAWLIERAGFPKGTRRGNVGLSTKHSLALVAHDGATTTELLRFADEVVAGVASRFGVRLEREPILWPTGGPAPSSVPE